MSRFLISCGGTGGHLSPGIALAEGLLARGHEVTLLISRKKVDARLIEKYPAAAFERMPGTAFSWQPVRLARCLVSQARALAFCLRLIREQRPDVIVGFGGFTSAPVALAGRLARHSRRAARIATACPASPSAPSAASPAASTCRSGSASRAWAPRPPATSACRCAARSSAGRGPRPGPPWGSIPTRRSSPSSAAARARRSLNEWARQHFALLAAEGIQVYCVTGLGKGEPEIARAAARRPGAPVRAIFTPFCDRVAELLSAADLVVTARGRGHAGRADPLRDAGDPRAVSARRRRPPARQRRVLRAPGRGPRRRAGDAAAAARRGAAT